MIINIFIVIALLVLVIGTIMTWRILKKQQLKEIDNTAGNALAKHPLLANPTIIGYLLIPAAVIVGVLLLFYFTY